jgi:glycosyltransferase involved in cell wall biosynthesis
MNPLISVIIPAHNNSATIGDAVLSILDQTYRNLEIVIVDDNSTDDTFAIAKEFAKKDPRVSVYTLPFDDRHRFNKRGRNINAGYSARNYAFEKVKGEWITFQDADDVSLLNRIEVQYELAQKYQAVSICLDWQQYKKELVGKKMNVKEILKKEKELIVSKEKITALAKKTKGIIIPLLGPVNSIIPFEWKRKRVINKLFFGSLDAYPGTGNSPLFKREVIEKVKFRPLKDRIWPSFMGRGADRDFNFQVAETFQNSITVFLPLYLWKSDKQNPRYESYKKYIT